MASVVATSRRSVWGSAPAGTPKGWPQQPAHHGRLREW